AFPWPFLPAHECIRATALGASEYSVQLSGNTSYISAPGVLLPRRNLQVLQPPWVCTETIDPDAVAQAIRGHIVAFDVEDEREIALAFRWQGAPSYERLAAFPEASGLGSNRAARAGGRATSCSTATWRRRSAISCATSWRSRASSW